MFHCTGVGACLCLRKLWHVYACFCSIYMILYLLMGVHLSFFCESAPFLSGCIFLSAFTLFLLFFSSFCPSFSLCETILSASSLSPACACIHLPDLMHSNRSETILPRSKYPFRLPPARPALAPAARPPRSFHQHIHRKRMQLLLIYGQVYEATHRASHLFHLNN